MGMLAINLYCMCAAHCGVPLPGLVDEIRRFYDSMVAYKQHTVLAIFGPMAQGLANCAGQADDPTVLTGEFLNQDEAIRLSIENNNKTALTAIMMTLTEVLFYLDELEAAEARSEMARGAETSLRTALPVCLYHQMTVMVAMGQCRRDSSSQEHGVRYRRKRRLRFRRARRSWKELDRLAKNAPHTCLNKSYLVGAEIAFSKGHGGRGRGGRGRFWLDKAFSSYRVSISIAKKEGYLQDEAMACEGLAEALLSVGRIDEATSLYQRARDCYDQWGCPFKVERLDKRLSKYNTIILP